MYDTDKPIPETKSSVGVNKKAPAVGVCWYKMSEQTANRAQQTAKFKKNDTVHMTVIENGIRKKGTYTVYEIGTNSAGFVQYQLEESKGKLFNGGKWVREGDLKMDKRG